MVERIKQLLQERGLSPTQFADFIGVTRPVVSHVLSERNKPSLEVVQRILAAFPELSMAWLLNGTGPMLVVEPLAGPVAGPVAGPMAGTRPPVVAAAGVEIPAASPKELSGAGAAAVASQHQPKVTQEAAAGHGFNAENNFNRELNLGNQADNQKYAPTAATVYAPVATVGATPAVVLLPKPSPPLRQPSRRFAPAVAPAGFAPAAAAVAASAAPKDTPPVVAPPVVNAPPAPATPAPLLAAATTEESPVNGAAPSVSPTLSGLAVGKSIRRIVIFYQDGSFSDFAPE